MRITIEVKVSARARNRRAGILAELARRHAPTARLRAQAEAEFYKEARAVKAIPTPRAEMVGLVDPANPAASKMRWRLVV